MKKETRTTAETLRIEGTTTEAAKDHPLINLALIITTETEVEVSITKKKTVAKATVVTKERVILATTQKIKKEHKMLKIRNIKSNS